MITRVIKLNLGLLKSNLIRFA